VVLTGVRENRYEIHKLDMDDDDNDEPNGGSTGTVLRRFPEPPAVVGTGSWMQFAALGSSIIGTGFSSGPNHEGLRASPAV
jgi:hypothetical protein